MIVVIVFMGMSQIFGYDFIFDEAFHMYLLEVNTNPYIGCSSALLDLIFSGMLEGAFRLTLDKKYPPPSGAEPLPDVEGCDLWDLVLPGGVE